MGKKYSVSEAGEILGWSPAYIGQLIRRKKIKARKTWGDTGHYRIDEEEIERIISQKEGSDEERT